MSDSSITSTPRRFFTALGLPYRSRASRSFRSSLRASPGGGSRSSMRTNRAVSTPLVTATRYSLLLRSEILPSASRVSKTVKRRQTCARPSCNSGVDLRRSTSPFTMSSTDGLVSEMLAARTVIQRLRTKIEQRGTMGIELRQVPNFAIGTTSKPLDAGLTQYHRPPDATGRHHPLRTGTRHPLGGWPRRFYPPGKSPSFLPLRRLHG